MDRRLPTWKFFRIALVFLSAPAWLLIRSAMQDEFSTPPSWHFLIILIGLSGFSVLLLSVLQSDKEWASPRWSENPLNNDRPLEGFHLSAWSFLAGAFALFLAGMLREPVDWAWVLPGCIGLGLWVGICLVSTPERRHGT